MKKRKRDTAKARLTGEMKRNRNRKKEQMRYFEMMLSRNGDKTTGKACSKGKDN